MAQLLADYYCITVEMLAELRGANHESGRRNIRAILQRLHRHGYLSRVDFIDTRMTRGRNTAYGLSDSGVSWACQEGFSTLSTKTLDEHSSKTIEHELEITRFHIALKGLCHARGWELYWRQTCLKQTVHPDALFGITAGDTTHYWFLEIERAKLGNYKDGTPQILRKLPHYWAYYDTTDCEEEWGFRHFRVITVVPSAERMNNLVDSMRMLCDKRTFWFATEGDCRNNVADAIFVNPRRELSSFTAAFSA